MTNSLVSITKASAYIDKDIRNAVIKSLAPLGGLKGIISPKSRVFVKINFLSPLSAPDRAIYTHPVFTQEVVRLLLEQDCTVTIGDDIPSKQTDFSLSGYHRLSENLGVDMVNLKEFGFREVKLNGKVLSHTYISTLLLDSDFIINLPKLKTHSFTVYTGAVKNMYGGIPHGLRLKYHDRFRQPESFSQMLVDIFSRTIPHLTIMDGITGMEGEGPSAGYPRDTGVIITGKDAVAVDAIASFIVGFNPMDIYTTHDAHSRKLGNGDIKTIETTGEDVNNLRIPGFRHSSVATGLLMRKLPQTLYAVIQEQLTLTPEIIRNKCNACLECIEICPPDAIQLIGDKACVDKKLCIHCMCCHEICRFRAIMLKQRPVGIVIRCLERIYKRTNTLFSRT